MFCQEIAILFIYYLFSCFISLNRSCEREDALFKTFTFPFFPLCCAHTGDKLGIAVKKKSTECLSSWQHDCE